MEQRLTKVMPLQLLDLHDDALSEICQKMHGALHWTSACHDECRICPTLLKDFSSTCKRLRSLALPLLFRKCTFGVQCGMTTNVDQPSNLALALSFAQRLPEAAKHVREITFYACQLCDPVTSMRALSLRDYPIYQIIDVAKDCAKSLAYFKNLKTLRITYGKPCSRWRTFSTNYHLDLITEFEKSFRQNCPQTPSIKTLILDRDPGTLLTAFPNIKDLTIHGERNYDYDTGGDQYTSPYFQKVQHHPPRLQRLELLTTWSALLLRKILILIPTLRVLSMPAPPVYGRRVEKYLDDFETFIEVLARYSKLEILQLDRDMRIEPTDEDPGWGLRSRLEYDTELRKRVFDMCRSLKRMHLGEEAEYWVERHENGEVKDVRIIYPPPPPMTWDDVLMAL